MADPTPLHPKRDDELRPSPASKSQGGPPEGFVSGPPDAGRVLDAARSAADTEFQIAERLSAKSRQAFALAAGFFAICQTVSFGSFEADLVSDGERLWIIRLAIGAAALLMLSSIAAMVADSLFRSGDLPVNKMTDELDAAYDGDDEVLQRLTETYLGIVVSRRKANRGRRTAYKWARVFVMLTLLGTTTELIVAMTSRI